MKYAILLALVVAAACGKEEASTGGAGRPAYGTPSGTPTPAPTPSATPSATPTMDSAKAALEKAIADTKALIEKKQADAQALLQKATSDPMNATKYKAEADTLQKEIADLQAKLEGYLKEAAGK
jgi:hypothetical protein